MLITLKHTAKQRKKLSLKKREIPPHKKKVTAGSDIMHKPN